MCGAIPPRFHMLGDMVLMKYKDSFKFIICRLLWFGTFKCALTISV